MLLISLCLGTLIGLSLRDLRAVISVFAFAAVLLFEGFRSHHFDTWLGGLGWFVGNIAVYDLACLAGCLAGTWILEARRGRRATSLARLRRRVPVDACRD